MKRRRPVQVKKSLNIKSILTLTAAFVLVAALSIGGTLAWLQAETDPVVNTFTAGDINIDLTESEDLDLKMVPGDTITKDPKVIVEANSEACWLFVKIEESENLDTYISYEVDDAWTELEDGVYYIEVDAATAKAGEEYAVLKGDEVTVLDVTEENMEAAETTKPTLTFTAYAIQSANLTDDAGNEITTAAAAWALTGN